MISVLFHFSLLFSAVQAGHYKGGTITWKPTDPDTNSSVVEIIITQSHSWTLSRYPCTQSLIDSLGSYLDGGSFYGQPFVQCQSSTAACTSSGYTTVSQPTYCTDFSTAVQISSGSLIVRRNINRNTNILAGFTGSAWAGEILTVNGTGASAWRVITRIDLTQKYPLNTSPVTGSLPIIRVIEGRTTTIQIPAGDWDKTDDVRCRWASSTGAAGDECGDICDNLPGAVISLRECTITWNAVRRPTDISLNLATSTYVAAIMVEDFVNVTSSSSMSSVPLQMLIFVYTPASGACNVTPEVIGDRPNRACIGVPIGVQLIERIVATVYCSGDYITEFVTISPLYMSKTAIAPVSGTTNQWYITLTWTPTNDQKGPQVFCASPIDQRGLSGPQHCINFVVGYSAPNLITPVFVQGSASPLGTVFANHSIFTIQATGGVYHPNRNGTYVKIFNRNNTVTPEWQADCGYSPDCIYSGQTVIFNVRNASWTEGGFYYVLLSSGAASGNVFCSPESSPITDPNFWTFNIWDPGHSSTTTTTTTPPTTGTVTTRPMLTTTPIANLTTTGIIQTSATTITITTTTITTTSTVTTTTPSLASITTTVTSMNILTPQGLEEQCRQPVAITNALTMIVMGAVHVLGVFAMFIKLDKLFNPNRLAATARQMKVAFERRTINS